MKTKWKKFLNLYDKKYHIFVSYCETDRGVVGELIQYLEAFKCVINDPEREAIPGQPLLRASIDKGIEQSKITILFITKHFLSDDFCKFVLNFAIWKYITTKGIHRVFPILLEPCKVPRCLKVLNCIHVWKYATQSQEISQQGAQKLNYQFQIFKRLSKAITESPPKFRRIRWNGIKTLTWTKDLLQKVKQSALKDRACKDSSPSLNPFHLWRLSKILEHCYINCRYGHCTFACSGRNFNMFINHVTKCRYKPIKCPNQGCRNMFPKWASDKHLEECQFSPIVCPAEGCKTKIQRGQLDQHLLSCQNFSVHCQNALFGCDKIITRKELNAHLDTCLYKSTVCEKCGIRLLVKDLEKHAHDCIKGEVICTLCWKILIREDEINHPVVCLMVDVVCPNQGCGVLMKRYQGYQHRNLCLHRISDCLYTRHGCQYRDKQLMMDIHVVSCQFRPTQCEMCGKWKVFKTIEKHKKKCEMNRTCELCRMTVKRSVWRTHERTCPRKNWQTHCDICHTLLKGDRNTHRCSSSDVNSPEDDMSSDVFQMVTNMRLEQKEHFGPQNKVRYNDCKHYPTRYISSTDQGPKRNEQMKRSSSEEHRPKRNRPISSTSSDEQETDSTTPVLIMASDTPGATGSGNGNYNMNHLNRYANARKHFNDFFKGIDINAMKSVIEHRNRQSNPEFKNLKFN